MQEKEKRENIEIQVQPRKPGKGMARRLRKNQLIPAILYGRNKENKTFSVLEMDAIKYSSQKYENTIFTLKANEDSGMDQVQVLKKDTAIHPVTKRPLHIDFYAIDKTRAVKVNVELQFVGKAAGEKEGGILSVLRRDVEIECLPSEIPRFFKLNISHLKVDDVLHVSDIQVPEGIKLMTDPKETVATVSLVEEETKEKEGEKGALEGTEESSEVSKAGGEGNHKEAASSKGSKSKSSSKKS